MVNASSCTTELWLHLGGLNHAKLSFLTSSDLISLLISMKHASAINLRSGSISATR